MKWSFLFVLGVGLLAATGCSDDTGALSSDGQDGAPADAGVDGVLQADGSEDGGQCPQVPCPAGQACYDGTCLPQGDACDESTPCLNDQFCQDGVCLPFGPDTKENDPQCINDGFEPEALQEPVLKCSWEKEGFRSSAYVADLDGDQFPEIIFPTYGGDLVAVRADAGSGADCTEVFREPQDLDHGGQLAVGDLDGDGVPEIVGTTKQNEVVVTDNQGKRLAISSEQAKGGNWGDSPAIANLDGQGLPEIIFLGMALRYENNALTVLYNVGNEIPNGPCALMTAVADVDLDGMPDLVASNRILDGATGIDKTPEPVKDLPGGHVAIAQFDPSTPEPEVVLAGGAELYIFNPVTGQVVFGPYGSGPELGGAPTVADFDGDGEPEIGTAGNGQYAVFDPECDVDPVPGHCHAKGVRWVKNTQDKSSGCTGSSVFDFNGDGKAEVVYRDECWLRIYDGATGQVRAATFVASTTRMELPVIADVDRDGHAEIVVSTETAGDRCNTPEPDLNLPVGVKKNGVLVFEDPNDRWMPSRSIWNQHTYHITNINDDVTVPVQEENSWDAWNNYRQNTQGMVQKEVPAPDLTSRWYNQSIDPSTDCESVWVLMAEVCNRGTELAPVGLPGTFYLGDPRTEEGQALCTGYTGEELLPGECALVQCEWEEPEVGQLDLWFWADPPAEGADPAGENQIVECQEGNNLFQVSQIQCPGTIG